MSEYTDIYGQYPNEFGTWYYRLQKAGVRYNLRQPPLFMIMNLKRKLCWCGKSFKFPRRKYCSNKHADWWFYYIRAYWDSFRLEIIRASNYKCALCGIHKKGETKFFDVDHILAITNGGMCFDTDNVRPLCQECHKRKTKNDMGIKTFKRKKLQTLEKFLEFTY